MSIESSQVQIIDLFNSLKGEWILHRQITPGGVMSGKAVFLPQDEHSYLYEEEGQLQLDNGVMTDFLRRYIYRLIDDDIHVYYADGLQNGQLFHKLDFQNETFATAEHSCPPDFYVSEYLFADGCFKVTHRVRGPKKDYVSLTDFTR